MRRLTAISLPLALAFLAPAVARAAATPPAASRVSVDLAFDKTALAAGKPVTAAVTLSTSLNWHIYWSNPGESGIPTSFAWKVPAGFRVEPLPMPIPETFVMPGNITCYGYTGKTTFLFKITPPDTLGGDAAPSLSVTANWLVCNKDECVPGNAAKSVDLKVSDAPADTNVELFKSARAALPAVQPPTDLFAMAVPTAAGPAEKYDLQIGWGKLPASVEIYPPNLDGLDIKLESADTTAGQPRRGTLMAVNRTLAGDTLAHLRVHVMAGQKVTAEKVPLLIVYTLPGDNTRRAFTYSVDASALGIKP